MEVVAEDVDDTQIRTELDHEEGLYGMLIFPSPVQRLGILCIVMMWLILAMNRSQM